MYVAKDEDDGDGILDRYTDFKPWASSLLFPDFGNYNLSAAGIYYVQIRGKILQQHTGMDGFTVFGGKMTVTYRQ